MSKVQICVSLTEEAFRSFEAEARREGVTVVSLLERTVNRLLQDLEEEQEQGTDSPFSPS